MSKIFKDEHIPEQYIPAKTVTKDAGYKCDLCDRTTSHTGQYEGKIDWATGNYDVENVSIGYRHGESYPEDTFTETEYFSICPDCWNSKVKPAIQQLGATLIVEE